MSTRKKQPTEHEVQKAILQWLGKRGKSRLYRNNAGMKGYVRFGLCKGASDLIGWESVRITEDMIGQRIAVFSAIEVKGPRGCLTPEQEEFLALVEAAGGFACMVRSIEEAQEEHGRRR